MSSPPPIDAPVTIQRTDTGQFLLRHPSGVTALGETLDEAWAALSSTLAASTLAAPTQPYPSAPPTPDRSGPRWRLALVAVLAFAWIGALYLALGSIRAEVAGIAPAPSAHDPLSARVGALEAEVSRLGAALDAARRMVPPPPDVPAVVPLPKPPPPADAPLPKPQPPADAPSPAPPGSTPAPAR